MAGIDRSTQRVIAVIALMTVAALALRGYIPGGERVAEREKPPSNPAALAVVVVMLSAAVAIIGFAIIARLRDRAPGALRRAPAAQPGRDGAADLALLADRARHGHRLAAARAVVDEVGWAGPPEQPASAPPAVPDTSAPEPRATDPPRASESEPESDTNVVGYLVPPMLMSDGPGGRRHGGRVAPTGERRAAVPRRRLRRRRTRNRHGRGFLARAAEVGLAEIGDLTREPREAIIACYAAMERELTRVPGAVPQDCDTPSEVLARAVDNRALRADSATELVELFEEARFSPHVMSEAHRDAAVSVLERVLAELPDGAARSSA